MFLTIFSWNNDLILQLIKEYKKYECLCVSSNKHYKFKENAWKEINNTLNVNVAEIKCKMENLMNQFYNEQREDWWKTQALKLCLFQNGLHMLYLRNKNKI